MARRAGLPEVQLLRKMRLPHAAIFCDEWGMAKRKKNAAAVALGRLGRRFGQGWT